MFLSMPVISGMKRSTVAITLQQDAKLIADLATGKRAEDTRYKAVFIPEIRQNNNELSISRYIVKEIAVEELDLAKELKTLKNYQADFEQSQQVLASLLAKYQ